MTPQKNNIELLINQSAHPRIDLARAMQRLTLLSEWPARNKISFSRDELANRLGYKPTSGSAGATITALERFGLLQKLETEYACTDLANKILAAELRSSDYHDLIAAAFHTPEMYRWLDSKYGADLPEEIHAVLVGRYHNHNVNDDNVKSIVDNYLKSITFVKTLPSSGQSNPSDTTGYVEINFKGHTISVSKKYLLEAIQKTRDDDMAKINESLK